MVGDLREVTQQKEFKETIINLNAVLKNLHQITTPDGKMVKNLDGALESMHAMMDQANAIMKKINSNDGTLGKLINDTSIYDEMKAAIQSINLLLGKAGKLKTFIDLSAVSIPAYNGIRGALSVMIMPDPTRYYLLGIMNDSKGKVTNTTTTTSVNGAAPTTVTQSLNQEEGFRVTAILGKYFGPLEVKAGIIDDDGAVGAGYWFDRDRHYGLQIEGYSPGKGQSITARVYARAQVWSAVYVTAGVDSLTKYNGQRTNYAGAGIFFDDEDLKYLLVFK
jgi:phospholipid/cholesterol/gamma-HCH transport system substrate-binding protein